jgi:spore coat protein JC
MVTPQARAVLNDIATEEFAHEEMMGTITCQLLCGLCPDEIIKGGLDPYYVGHGLGVYPCSAAGVPFSASALQSKGDPVTDLYEDLAAEKKALKTYDYLLDLTMDPDVIKPLKFLREREIVHFQRFGEALDIVKFYLGENKTFCMPEVESDKCK